MGSLLRLDRRVELSSQPTASATVITEASHRVSTGWCAAIRPHDKPDERLRRWSRTQIRPSEMEIVEGSGTKTYLELPEGLYEAHSAWRDGVAHRCVFRVDPDGQVEVIDQRGLREDLVIAILLGLTASELEEAREARVRSLHESAIAAMMAPLVGTPKQLSWVAEFRLAKYRDASEYLESRLIQLRDMSPEDLEYFRTRVAVEWLAVALEALRDEADAGWWISVVGVKGRESLRALARRMRDGARSVQGGMRS